MTDRKKKIFLKHYSDEMNIFRACAKCGIGRTTYYNWLEKDNNFRDSVKEIKKGVFDIAQSVLIRAMGETKDEKNKMPTANAIKVALFMYKELVDDMDDTDDGYEIIQG